MVVAAGALGAVLATPLGASPSGAATIAWSRLRNPILSFADRAAKDPALVRVGREWVAVYSAVDTRGRWRIGISTSADLTHWSAPRTFPHDRSVEGEASPDVVRAPSRGFVVTYQSFVHDVAGGQAKLYYRTTTDFRRFSPAHPLGHELHPRATDRMIDAAVVWTPAGLLLGYKVGGMNGRQAFEIARSSSGTLDGPWTLVGRPDIVVLRDTIENYQFLHLDGGWQLLATSNQLDQPYLFTLLGDPADVGAWLRWSPGRALDIPKEPFNHGVGVTGATYEHANCAYLVDQGPVDGYDYLVYSDAPEVRRFGGAGHAVLALARSRDLVHWVVPPAGS